MESTMGERIALIISEKAKNQSDFAEKLRITPAYVTKMINKGAIPSERLIDGICQKYCVNRRWLLTGEGEKYKVDTSPELEALVERYPSMTHETRVLIEKLVNLSEDAQKAVAFFLRDLVNSFGDVNSGTKAKPQGKLGIQLSDGDIEALQTERVDDIETDAESEYEKSSGFAQATGLSALNTTGGTEASATCDGEKMA